jgi:hypothetical protein
MAPPSPYDPPTSARPLSHTVGELRAFGYAMWCSQAFRGVAPRGERGTTTNRDSLRPSSGDKVIQ